MRIAIIPSLLASLGIATSGLIKMEFTQSPMIPEPTLASLYGNLIDSPVTLSASSKGGTLTGIIGIGMIG